MSYRYSLFKCFQPHSKYSLVKLDVMMIDRVALIIREELGLSLTSRIFSSERHCNKSHLNNKKTKKHENILSLKRLVRKCNLILQNLCMIFLLIQRYSEIFRIIRLFCSLALI